MLERLCVHKSDTNYYCEFVFFRSSRRDPTHIALGSTARPC